MAWNLKGSYVETCSCDLICPCNASLAHGATNDYCRVTLAFNIKEGEIEGTDVAGLKVVAVADTPKVMTDGNWSIGIFIDESATDEQEDKLTKVFGGQLGGPMEAVVPLIGEMRGVERSVRHHRRRAASYGQSRRCDRLRDRGHRPVRYRDGRAGPVPGNVPSSRFEPHNRRGHALEHRRVRHHLRGQDGAVDVRVLVGRVS